MGWIERYAAYAGDTTDAPQEFHLAVARTVLAAAVGGRVVFPFQAGIHPNIYTLILAPSSSYRKSTSMEIGVDVLRAASEQSVITHEGSYEAFFDEIREKQFGLVCVDEFGELLSQMSREYNKQYKEFLTRIYNCSSRIHRIKAGKDGERKHLFSQFPPVVSMISGSTIAWVKDRVSEEDFLGGFFARFAIVTAGKKKPFVPLPPPRNEATRSALISELQAIQAAYPLPENASQRPTTLAFEPDARCRYEEWANCYRQEKDNHPRFDASYMDPLLERLFVMCIKHSIIESASEMRTSIGLDNVLRAIETTETLKKNALDFEEREIAFTREHKEKQTILGIIRRAGEKGVDHSQLSRHSKMKAKDLKGVTETLLEEELIESVTQTTKGRPRVVWYLSEHVNGQRQKEEPKGPVVSIDVGGTEEKIVMDYPSIELDLSDAVPPQDSED